MPRAGAHGSPQRQRSQRGPCAAVLLSPGCSAGTGSVISFLSSRAGSRDAGVLFLAVTQPPSCPGKCFSPFHVPGYLSVTHALRNGSSALRDSPDKRLRSRLAAGVILAAAQALPRCYPTDPIPLRSVLRLEVFLPLRRGNCCFPLANLQSGKILGK